MVYSLLSIRFAESPLVCGELIRLLVTILRGVGTPSRSGAGRNASQLLTRIMEYLGRWLHVATFDMHRAPEVALNHVIRSHDDLYAIVAAVTRHISEPCVTKRFFKLITLLSVSKDYKTQTATMLFPDALKMFWQAYFSRAATLPAEVASSTLETVARITERFSTFSMYLSSHSARIVFPRSVSDRN